MQLTETQIEQANALIAKYKFCSLETQKRLQEAGFFEKVETAHKLYLQKSKGFVDSETHKGMQELGGNHVVIHENRYDKTLLTLPMPQFEEVWEALPNRILIGSYENLKCVLEKKVYYAEIGDGTVDAFNVGLQFENINICESACLLWLKLKVNNLI